MPELRRMLLVQWTRATDLREDIDEVTDRAVPLSIPMSSRSPPKKGRKKRKRKKRKKERKERRPYFGLVVKEELHNTQVPFHRRTLKCRGIAVGPSFVWVGAVLQQHLDNSFVALLCRQHYRRRPLMCQTQDDVIRMAFSCQHKEWVVPCSLERVWYWLEFPLITWWWRW